MTKEIKMSLEEILDEARNYEKEKLKVADEQSVDLKVLKQVLIGLSFDYLPSIKSIEESDMPKEQKESFIKSFKKMQDEVISECISNVNKIKINPDKAFSELFFVTGHKSFKDLSVEEFKMVMAGISVCLCTSRQSFKDNFSKFIKKLIADKNISVGQAVSWDIY